MHEKKRIAVFGAGGIGGVVGGMLSKDGHEVTLIETWHEHITEIQKNGLEVMFPIGKPVGKPVNSSVTTLDL